MKILVISRNFPSDFHTKVHGVYQRLRLFLDGIKEIASIDMLFYVSPDLHVHPSFVSQVRRSFLEHWDIEVNLFLFPTVRVQEEEKIMDKLYCYFVGSMSLFKQPGYVETSGPQQLQAFEACLHYQPDAIFVDKLQAMCPLLLTQESLPPIFFNLDGIEHIALIRSVSKMPRWRTKLLLYSRVPALVLGECRATRLAEKTFVCSEIDRRYLANYWGSRNVVMVPNAVSIPERQPLPVEPTILFIGSYTYRPNVEAAEFLIEKFWPKVHKEMPTAKLIIAGVCPDRIRGYGVVKNGIELPGFVDDLGELYSMTRIVCAPILTGAGTRVKIIEAAAYGKPIVATRLGAEGLDMRDGQEILLRDDVESFVEACLQLLRDVFQCERLGKLLPLGGAKALPT
jgi:glycosyltransferase involved in cell wall biosynthesis